MKTKSYLDNAATTMVAPEVLFEMQAYFTQLYGNASSLHQLGQEARTALEAARSKIAKMINASAGEIVFTSGGTEANNLAIKGVAEHRQSGHIITSKIEHPATLETCKSLEAKGFVVTYLPVDKDGKVDLKSIENSIKDNTFLVSVMHANNEIGSIQDLDGIGALCSRKGILFHTDAAQTFTKLKTDVNQSHIDLMSLSSHKIHGPKGVGALYIRRGVQAKSQMHGGQHEFRLRPGTENLPGIVGFAKAAELITSEDIKRMSDLRTLLLSQMLSIPNTRNNSPEDCLCNIINISFRGVEGESITLLLSEEGIMVSTGSACSSASLEPSHVLMAIGLDHETAHGSIRFSLSRYTTKEEVMLAVEKTKQIILKLRKISPLGRQ